MRKLFLGILFLFVPFLSSVAEFSKTEINWPFPKETTFLNDQKTFALNFSVTEFLAEKNSSLNHFSKSHKTWVLSFILTSNISVYYAIIHPVMRQEHFGKKKSLRLKY